MKTGNLNLQEEIVEELTFDPQIVSDDVAIAVSGGVVTLHGTVPSLMQKWGVEDAVKRIPGVRGIANELSVDLPSLHARNDTDIARAIERRFESNALVPSEVQFMVQEANVTLTGSVEWYYQSREAENEAQRVTGVRDIFNKISIEPKAAIDETEIKRKIRSELARAADYEANQVIVSVLGTIVRLTGTVRNWYIHDKAVDAAWRVPGVTRVESELEIAPVA